MGSISASNISCTLITSNGDEKSLLLGNPEASEMDIYLHRDQKSSPSIQCELRTSQDITVASTGLLFKLKYSNGIIEHYANFTKTSSNIYEAKMSISINHKLADTDVVPFELKLIVENRIIPLGKGTVVLNEVLQTFSQSRKFAALSSQVMKANYSDVKWKFLPSVCNSDTFLAVPAVIDSQTHKSGIPIGKARGSDNLEMITWELFALSFPNECSLVYDSKLLENFLLLYSNSCVYLVPSVQDTLDGNATRNLKEELSWGTEISQILSISSTTECRKNNGTIWYDMAIVVRFNNATIGAMLGYEPFKMWDIYLFPDWFKPAQRFTVELDAQTQTLVILVTIGESLSSTVLVYKLKRDSKQLILHAVPFTLKSKLNTPVLKLLPSIPAIAAYDQKQVWLSVDTGRYFQQIFIAKDNQDIKSVIASGTFLENIAIMSDSNIHMLNSKGLHKAGDLSGGECSNSSLVVCRVNNEGSIKCYCSADFFNATVTSNSPKFSLLQYAVPSFVAEMRSEFEVSMRLDANVYANIAEMQLQFNSICLISRYPIIHVCNTLFSHGQHSLLMHTSSKINTRILQGCMLKLHKANTTSKFTIQAMDDVDSTSECKGWTESDIGQTLQIPSIQAACWIYWLMKDGAAEATCYGQLLISSEVALTFRPGKWMLLDGRGTERCFKANVTLNGTNAGEPLSMDVIGVASSFLQHGTFIRLSEVVGQVIDANATLTVTLYTTASKRSFDYICIINGQSQQSDVLEKVLTHAQACHFSVTSNSSIASEVFLGANDRTTYNLTVTKLDNNMPYWDTIPPVSIELSDRENVKIQVSTQSNASTKQQLINVFLTQKPHINGTTILRMYTPVQPAHCNAITSKVTIHGTCPPQKRLLFEYPMVFSRHTWLHANLVDADDIERIASLPYNYQPPSHRGKAIPMTKHIYNADPSKPMHRARYKVTRDMAKYKQCSGKLNRSKPKPPEKEGSFKPKKGTHIKIDSIKAEST
eukprot:gene5253-5917_t